MATIKQVTYTDRAGNTIVSNMGADEYIDFAANASAIGVTIISDTDIIVADTDPLQEPQFDLPWESTGTGTGTDDQTGAEVTSTYSGTNYTETGTSVDGHLQGIDTALASAGGGTPSSVISPASDDATGAIGTGTDYAREDHKHPAQGVSADAEQLLKDGTDGLAMLDPDDLISTDADNAVVKGTDGKLHAPTTSFADAISPAADDSTGAIGVLDEAAREDHKHPAQGVSADADNLLAVGTDGLHQLEADSELISVDSDNMLIKGTDGKLTASLDAATIGVPLTGDWLLGWTNGTLTIFPK